jgi:hypothetical protein
MNIEHRTPNIEFPMKKQKSNPEPLNGYKQIGIMKPLDRIEAEI